MYLYATRAGFEIGRVRMTGSVLSSISSRISAVAFTKVTKIRTTWRYSGTMKRWNRMMSNDSMRAPARESVKMSGKAARRAVAMTRRVPRRYRRVRLVTTHAFRKDSVHSIRSPDEIPEHRVETVIRTLEPLDLELRVRDDLGELSVERVRLSGAHEQHIGRREFEGDDVIHPGESVGKWRGFRRLDSQGRGVFVDERGNGVDAARRNRFPVVNQHDVVRDALDLIEDVGRHDHVAAVAGEVGDRPQDVDPSRGVRPGERLIEDQDLRVVGEGLCKFRALAHPATVSAGGSVRRTREADDLQGRSGLLAGLRRRHPIEPQQGLNELLSRQPSVELILFRTLAETPLKGDVVPRVLAEQRDLALVRMELPDEELEQRGLARAVRPYEAGDPFAEGSGECVEAEHLAVPLRDGRCFHDAVHPVITSTAFIRTYVKRAARTVAPSRIARAAGQSIPAPAAPNPALATAR